MPTSQHAAIAARQLRIAEHLTGRVFGEYHPSSRNGMVRLLECWATTRRSDVAELLSGDRLTWS